MPFSFIGTTIQKKMTFSKRWFALARNTRSFGSEIGFNMQKIFELLQSARTRAERSSN